MSNCIAPGWGVGPYGMTPWGGSLSAIPGGNIPAVLPFDIYCVGPCGPMSVMTTYTEVDEIGAANQFAVDPVSQDEIMRSGGMYSTDDVRIIITTSVPQVFTLDFTCKFPHLPNDFTDIVNRHILINLTDAAGPCVGLFFSKVGIAYIGGVHHTGGGDLVLDSVFQPLPNSQLLVSETDYWSFRIAANFVTGGVYIYVTKTADLPIIGHQLRYVLPIIPAAALATPPTDRTLLSVRGSLGQPSELWMDSICLGSGFIIPNLPPTADAGLDQAVRTCSIIRLDGSKSFDPEGAEITYKWRLIDAPIGSEFLFDSLDGKTFPLMVPTGFTNKFYSVTMAVFDAATPIQAGDVLLIDAEAYTITGKGSDVDGFYVTVDGFVLPDDLTLTTFKILLQNGLSGPTTINPTFYPDLPGLWKFDLVVFDGGLSSEPAIVVVNVTESPVPRGCIPDLRFLWNYLSNFWNLVDDKDRITTFFGAVAQVAASELLTLWQTDYSKSLRDVQRTFQRRWLHYDPPLLETLSDLSTTRALHNGCRSVELAVAGTSAYAGTTVTLSSPLFADISYTFPGGSLTPASIAAGMQLTFQQRDSRIVVTAIVKQSAALAVVRIYAPFPFTLVHNGSTAFFVDFENAVPQGTSGAAVGMHTYQVDRSLSGLGIEEGDILTLDGVGYRIIRTTTEATDDWEDQRLTLADELPVAPPSSWEIPGRVTSVSLNFYTALFTTGDKATFSVVDLDINSEVLFEVDVFGATENATKVLSVDTTPFSHFLLDTVKYDVRFVSARRYHYLPIDDLIADIPYLQERILSKDDTAVLRRNIDFFIEPFRGLNSIRFNMDVWDTPPPDTIWAETTYLDNRPIIEQNFGIPADFTLDDLSQLPSNVDYLSAVRGIWYSYFNGPTLFNLRAGTQILLGLPFAEEASTIEEIRTDFSPTQGRLLLRDKANPEIVRSYTFPVSLELEINPATGVAYVVGDEVTQFAPLVTGTEVVDYIKDPSWFQGYLNQGVFFEIEKFFKFLVRVDSAAFNLSALLFVQSFVKKIKPTYTYPLFVVQKKIGDTEISTTDDVNLTGTLLLFDGACFPNSFGVATMFDEPDPSGGGWQSQFDTDMDPGTSAPVFPTPQLVGWGYDKNYLCPEDYILATACVTFAVPTMPTVDSIFAWDTEIFQDAAYVFEDSWVLGVPGAGFVLFNDLTPITANGTITDVELTIVGDPGASDPDYIMRIRTGPSGGPYTTTVVPFTQPGTSPFVQHTTVSIPIVMGDVLFVTIQPNLADDTSPYWESISVELGTSVVWAYDANLPAGTYCAYKTL